VAHIPLHWGKFEIYQLAATEIYRCFYLFQSSDRLQLLSDGKLRHYTNAENEEDERHGIESDYDEDIAGSLEPRYHDYDNGLYCIDKV